MTKVKEFFLYLFCFITVIQIGFLMTEYVKIIIATLLGFSYEFRTEFGTTMFYSDENWSIPYYKNQLYKIEMSGFIFTHFISLIGLSALLIRKKYLLMQYQSKDMLFAIMSLFFMRDIIFPGVFVFFGSIPCQVFELYKGFVINGFLLLKIHFILGLSGCLAIIWLLPSNKRLLFLISGILGAILSFFIAIHLTSILL